MHKLSEYPVRPFPHENESLDGYIYRFYASNGHRIPPKINQYLREMATRSANHYADEIMDLADDFPIRPIIARSVHQNFVIKKKAPSLEFRMTGYKAYCPPCMAESAYHRHLWNFPLMKACPVHRCKLINACPHCGRRLTFSCLVHQWTCKCGRSISIMQTTQASAQDLELSSYIAGAPPYPATPMKVPAEEAIHELMEWAMTIRRIIKGTHTRTAFGIDQERIREEMSLFFKKTRLMISTPEQSPGDMPLRERHRKYIYKRLGKNQRASCHSSGKWEHTLLSGLQRIGPRFLRLIKALEKSNPCLFIDLTASPKTQLIYFATRKLLSRYGNLFREIQVSITSAMNKYVLSGEYIPMIFNPSQSDATLRSHYKRLARWWDGAESALRFIPRQQITLVHDLGIIPKELDFPLPSRSYIALVDRLQSLAGHPHTKTLTPGVLNQWPFPEQMKGKIRTTTLLLYSRLMTTATQEKIIRLVDQEIAALPVFSSLQ